MLGLLYEEQEKTHRSPHLCEPPRLHSFLYIINGYPSAWLGLKNYTINVLFYDTNTPVTQRAQPFISSHLAVDSDSNLGPVLEELWQLAILAISLAAGQQTDQGESSTTQNPLLVLMNAFNNATVLQDLCSELSQVPPFACGSRIRSSSRRCYGLYAPCFIRASFGDIYIVQRTVLYRSELLANDAIQRQSFPACALPVYSFTSSRVKFIMHPIANAPTIYLFRFAGFRLRHAGSVRQGLQTTAVTRAATTSGRFDVVSEAVA
ncbi:hypothetical protein EVAR_100217_1 [Eumeta japonica]|uniref:Uncharacterized protein n=1 Tax=Eumeta variegata TaxID=151549 RepID=A0A4C1ZKT1_EUMVA|nr:hypothetical protein EVAR_100217_1 [Eumeta japonica]